MSKSMTYQGHKSCYCNIYKLSRSTKLVMNIFIFQLNGMKQEAFHYLQIAQRVVYTNFTFDFCKARRASELKGNLSIRHL